jgi:hypothetical protein
MKYREEVEAHRCSSLHESAYRLSLIELGVRLGLEAAASICDYSEESADQIRAQITGIQPADVLKAKS